MTCKAVLNWAPATETIEQVVPGHGPRGGGVHAPASGLDGKASRGETCWVIEIDGKVSADGDGEELAQRRGKRRPGTRRRASAVASGILEPRREARGSKESRKRRREELRQTAGKQWWFVMYHAASACDGQLHVRLNKEVVTRRSRVAGARCWRRAEATKRGFGPDTTKTVQIV